MQLLPKMGYNRHMPRAVIAGPFKYGGNNFTTYWHEQHIQHIEHLIRYIRRKCPIGKLLLAMIDQFQFHLGIQQPFFTLSSTKYQYGLKSYIKYVWDACTEINMELHISNLYIPQSQYIQDHFIMDIFNSKLFSVWKLHRLNDVRLWK